jgi:hypothetical protein
MRMLSVPINGSDCKNESGVIGSIVVNIRYAALSVTNRQTLPRPGAGQFSLSPRLGGVPCGIFSANPPPWAGARSVGIVHFRDAAIGADPLTQPGPGAFHGVAVDLALAVTVQVKGVLTSTVIDRHMLIAITGEKVVDAITVRIDPRTALHHLIHNGLDGLRSHVAQYEQTNLAAPTQQPKDRQPVTVPGAPAAPFEPPSAGLALQWQATGPSFQASREIHLVHLAHILLYMSVWILTHAYTPIHLHLAIRIVERHDSAVLQITHTACANAPNQVNRGGSASWPVRASSYEYRQWGVTQHAVYGAPK